MRTIFFLSILLVASTISAAAHKVAIVTSMYHESLTEKLLEAATACLYKNGLNPEDIRIAYVPGSFEIPLTAKLIAETHHFDAIICLGAIAMANNPQWSFIADHVSKNIANVSLTYDIPITWGIFLFDSQEDAQEAANNLETNRGWQAAQAAVTMIGLAKQIKQFPQQN